MPCGVCGGRVIKTETGDRCMNSSCAGGNEAQSAQTVMCTACDKPMTYRGLNNLGEPNYKCPSCGKTMKL